MKDFIVTSRGAVNVAQVSFAAFNADGGITLSVGANSITFDAGTDDAIALNGHFERPAPEVAEDPENENPSRAAKKRGR